jgi:hypothetical protein
MQIRTIDKLLTSGFGAISITNIANIAAKPISIKLNMEFPIKAVGAVSFYTLSR